MRLDATPMMDGVRNLQNLQLAAHDVAMNCSLGGLVARGTEISCFMKRRFLDGLVDIADSEGDALHNPRTRSARCW
jgi:hypothetical protein